MSVGSYRIPILIQIRTDEKWVDFGNVHARVNGLSGSEYWAAAAVQAQNAVNFDVRYIRSLAKIAPQDCRIKFNGNLYDVQSIDDFEFRHQTLRLKGVMLHGR